MILAPHRDAIIAELTEVRRTMERLRHVRPVPYGALVLDEIRLLRLGRS